MKLVRLVDVKVSYVIIKNNNNITYSMEVIYFVEFFKDLCGTLEFHATQL